MNKIRTAILGYGRSGSTMHAGPIEKIDGFDMVAVCDVDPKRRDQASERFGCTVYEDYHEMLEKEELNLVCVITRNDQHCEMACDCLNAGVNVLVTKPWAANQSEAERMVSTAHESGKKLLPWLPERWGSELRRLRTLLRKDAIGNIFAIRRSALRHTTTGVIRRTWQRYSHALVDHALESTGTSCILSEQAWRLSRNPSKRFVRGFATCICTTGSGQT